MSLRWNPLTRLPARAARVGRAVVGLSMLSAAALSPACNGPVTEEDLQLWTHNEIGLERMTEVVTDPKQPLETRIRGLEVVVERGQPMRVRNMLDDMSDQRDAVVAGLLRELVDHVDKRSEAQYDAKDALMMMLDRYLTAEQKDQVQQRVAAWTFGDITWETPQAEVQDKIGQRITSGQIADLGKYGWQGAAILVSHGFIVDRMAEYLAKGGDAQALELLLRGLELTHERIGVQLHHVELVRNMKTPAAAAYLMRLYRNDQLDGEIRAAAFNAAIEMGEDPAVKAKPAALSAELLDVMKGSNPQDRWLAAVSLVQIEGPAKLDEVLTAFADDKIYDQAEEDPAKSALDLCLDLRKHGHAKAAAPTFAKRVADPNRIVRAISIICLKATAGAEAKPQLDELAKLVGKPEDVSVNDFLGEELTLGRLAANASQGLDLVAKAQAEHAAGQLDAIELDAKVQQIVVLLEESGDEYAANVEKYFGEWRAEYKANPDKFKPKAPSAPDAAPTAQAGDAASNAGK